MSVLSARNSPRVRAVDVDEEDDTLYPLRIWDSISPGYNVLDGKPPPNPQQLQAFQDMIRKFAASFASSTGRFSGIKFNKVSGPQEMKGEEPK